MHAAAREDAYRWVDIGQLARTLPGLAEVGGPVLAAAIGDPSRFPSGAHFKSFAGLAPKASETGQTDRKGEPMSKAGPNLLRATLVRAADTARKQDPQLARVYHQQMVERGANHLKATCVVAGHLAERSTARHPTAPAHEATFPTHDPDHPRNRRQTTSPLKPDPP
ncbi:transposase [Intrasporangium mesophilum]